MKKERERERNTDGGMENDEGAEVDITKEVTSHLKSLQRLIIIVIIRRYIEKK